ncbi:MAG: NFACT RNA binding domain-containing protein [bacterium]
MVPFKIKKFLSSAGLEILVGQDDESNDYLTFRVAHANDFWFHVSGTPGSHVILRCGEINVDPDRASLEEAAALAAWFSKMRKAGRVAVSYCQAKQVGKPRGAQPGKVSIKRAKNLMVRPHLLEQAS